MLASNVPARYVRGAVAAAGKFTIYLNAAAVAATPVTWIVFD